MPRKTQSRRAARVVENDPGFLRNMSGAAVACVMRRPLDSSAAFVAALAVLAIMVNALFLQTGRHPAPMLRVYARTAAKPATKPVIKPIKASAHDTAGEFERIIPRPRPAVLTRVSAPAVTPSKPPRTQAEIVTQIQRELAMRGYYDGAPDGLWGPKSDAAVRAFAERAGVKVPAEPNEQLLQAIAQTPIKAAPKLAAAPAAPPAPVGRDTLTPADTALPSPRLMAVQRVLADYGYGQIKPSGLEDAQTRAAITAFERERKLPPTGKLSDQLVRELSAMTGRPLE